jgi:hypothetical protein
LITTGAIFTLACMTIVTCCWHGSGKTQNLDLTTAPKGLDLASRAEVKHLLRLENIGCWFSVDLAEQNHIS